MAGVNIGKVYPGMQSGTATLAAGTAAVTFSPAFTMIPNVMVQNLTASTALVRLYPTGVSRTGFGCSSEEFLSLAGGTLVTTTGTTATSNFNWMAYVDN